jgi:ubiquinone/menaquinone biosynthesis C-methylase UbiE
MSRAFYEHYWSEAGFNPNGELAPETRRLLDSLIPRGGSLVDVGCGDGGAVGTWALQRDCDYLGLDVAENALERARARGLRVQLIDDASRLPLEDDSAMAVTCIEVLEHLVTPLDAAREIRRVLIPGGPLIASVPNAAYWVRRAELGLLGRFNAYGDHRSVPEPWRDPHLRFFTRGTLQAMLHEAGFSTVRIHAESHQPFSLRTRIEGSAIYLRLMRRWPSMLAPTLLVSAR